MKLGRLFGPRRPPKIFISYRRDDSEAYTDFLYDQLAGHFGKEQIFMDVDHIPVGVDFIEVIGQAVGSCDVLLAVIGKQWLNISEGGRRRLDNAEDFVRLEVASALERDILVAPVLIQGAKMPRADELPESLKKLTRRHAFEISRARRREDGERLIAEIVKVMSARGQLAGREGALLRMRAVWVVCAAAAVVAAAALWAVYTTVYTNRLSGGRVAGENTVDVVTPNAVVPAAAAAEATPDAQPSATPPVKPGRETAAGGSAPNQNAAAPQKATSSTKTVYRKPSESRDAASEARRKRAAALSALDQ